MPLLHRSMVPTWEYCITYFAAVEGLQLVLHGYRTWRRVLAYYSRPQTALLALLRGWSSPSAKHSCIPVRAACPVLHFPPYPTPRFPVRKPLREYRIRYTSVLLDVRHIHTLTCSPVVTRPATRRSGHTCFPTTRG